MPRKDKRDRDKEVKDKRGKKQESEIQEREKGSEPAAVGTDGPFED